MGFKLQYVVPETAVVAEHWQEMSLVYDMIQGKVLFQIGLYVDKKAFEEGKQPILTRSFEIEEGTQPQLAAAGKAFLIGYVKSQSEFEGAEDYPPPEEENP
jgi:hypothetical protein